MTSALEHLPAELRAFADSLLADGFLVTGAEVDEAHFGDVTLEFGRRGLSVRVIQDRGKWFIEIADPEGPDWFSPAVWQAVVEGAMQQRGTPMPVTDQIHFVQGNLERIERLVADRSGAVTRKLRSWQKARTAHLYD